MTNGEKLIREFEKKKKKNNIWKFIYIYDIGRLREH